MKRAVQGIVAGILLGFVVGLPIMAVVKDREAHAEPVRDPENDIKAYSAPEGDTGTLCWRSDGTYSEISTVELAATHLRDGTVVDFAPLPLAKWTFIPDTNLACANVELPGLGEWIYSARHCEGLAGCGSWSHSTNLYSSLVEGEPGRWYVIMVPLTVAQEGRVTGSTEKAVYGIKDDGTRSNIILSWVASGTLCDCSKNIDGINQYGRGYCDVSGALDSRTGNPVPDRQVEGVTGAYAACQVTITQE